MTNSNILMDMTGSTLTSDYCITSLNMGTNMPNNIMIDGNYIYFISKYFLSIFHNLTEEA